MPNATNNEVQLWSDQRDRVRAEQIRALVISLQGDTGSAFESVFLNLTNSPDWTDNRNDVPNNLTPDNLLAINAFNADVLAFILAHASYPITQKACVRPV